MILRYKQAYQTLKDLKIEIEHLQHLLEQARHRLTRDFEHWYVNVYLPTEARESADADVMKKLRGCGTDSGVSQYLDDEFGRSSVTSSPSTSTPNLFPSSSAPSLGNSTPAPPTRRTTNPSPYRPDLDTLTAPQIGATAASAARRAQDLLDKIDAGKKASSAPDLFMPKTSLPWESALPVCSGLHRCVRSVHY